MCENEIKLFVDLLEKFSPCFATNSSDLGKCTLTQHKINTADHPPISQHPFKSSWKGRELIQDQVDDLLRIGVIEPSTSPWASPVALIKKKDGTWRFCVDYRKLNTVTQKDVYPLPRIEDFLSCLEGSFYFSIMDMQSGYWQVEMKPDDVPKSAFITADGLYNFLVMPFGLTNPPSTFQRMMDVMLAGLKWNSCLVYLDDVIVFSRSLSEHRSRLEAVLQCILNSKLKPKLNKCHFVQKSLRILGHVVTNGGVSPDPEKLKAVKNIPSPTTLKDVQSIVGLFSCYRRFVPNFASIAKPLSDLSKQDKKFHWSPDQEKSFNHLKTALLSSVFLAHPNYEIPMEIHCDASNF